MIIREYTNKDINKMRGVARKLPSWFTKDATGRQMPLDFRFQQRYVAVEKGKIIGFISAYSYEGNPKLGWMGVLPEFHRRGIGKKLYLKLEKI